MEIIQIFFPAEILSTMNSSQLIFKHFLKSAKKDSYKAFLLGNKEKRSNRIKAKEAEGFQFGLTLITARIHPT